MVPWRGNQPLAPLSDSQLEEYLYYISSGTLNLAIVQHAFSLPSGRLNVLTTLIRLNTSRIQWGGLAYHYSDQPINSLEALDVFEKLVRRGLGGHCLEIVPLFAAVLRALGYDLYMTGARVSSAMAGDKADGLGFHGWSHLVLILTIDGHKYLVDPQYIEITEPVLLDPSGPDVTFNGIPTTIVRTRYCELSSVIPRKASNSGLMTWFLEYKRSATAEEWIPAYIFSTETEWYLEDLPVMNVWLAKAEDSYLVKQVIVKRLLLVGADDPADHVRETQRAASTSEESGLLIVPEISGTVELASDQLTVFRLGKKVIDAKIRTERERLDIFKKWFGITLTKEETVAILTRPTALEH